MISNSATDHKKRMRSAISNKQAKWGCVDERGREIDGSEENESEKESRYQEKKSIIEKTHFLFQVETFHLVLVLESSLLDLETLETFETPFDFGG